MEHIKMDLCQGFDGLLPKVAIVEPLNLIHDDSRWYYVMHWKLRPDSTWSIATNDKKLTNGDKDCRLERQLAVMVISV